MTHQMGFDEIRNRRASFAALPMSPSGLGWNRAGRSLTAGWLFSCFRTTPNNDDMAGNPLAVLGCFWRRYAWLWRKERLCGGHIRPLWWQPIPHCNDNSWPSAPMCGHKPARRLYWSLLVSLRGKSHLKASRTDVWIDSTSRFTHSLRMLSGVE